MVDADALAAQLRSLGIHLQPAFVSALADASAGLPPQTRLERAYVPGNHKPTNPWALSQPWPWALDGLTSLAQPDRYAAFLAADMAEVGAGGLPDLQVRDEGKDYVHAKSIDKNLPRAPDTPRIKLCKMPIRGRKCTVSD